MKIDEEGMSDSVDPLEYPLLRHKTVHFITVDYISFLQHLDGHQLFGYFVLRKQHLRSHDNHMIVISTQQCTDKNGLTMVTNIVFFYYSFQIGQEK